jgi:hypothetical protein
MPRKHIYDGIIVHHFAKEWTRTRAKNRDRWDNPRGSNEHFTQSFSQLLRVVCDTVDGNKDVNHTMFTSHLDRMVEEGTLHKHRRDGKRRYEYRLSLQKMISYLEYLNLCYLRSLLKSCHAPCCLLRWVNLHDFEIEVTWTDYDTQTFSFSALAASKPLPPQVRSLPLAVQAEA